MARKPIEKPVPVGALVRTAHYVPGDPGIVTGELVTVAEAVKLVGHRGRKHWRYRLQRNGNPASWWVDRGAFDGPL